MKRAKISRRTMLRGAGTCISLPLLDIMQGPSASAEPKAEQAVRAAYLYFPNGVADDAWGADKVDEAGRLLRLNKWMAPLEPFKADLILPKKMWTPRGNGHGAGTATWLTGGGYDDRHIDAGGISADQIAAQATEAQTLLPSLELSLKGEGYFSNSLVRNTLSWSTNGPVPRDVEPRVIFDRMFRSGDDAGAQASLLDGALEDAKAMYRRGSVADRRKIEEYLESIRAIERRLDFADKQAAKAAANPALTDSLRRPASGIPADHEQYMRTMFDMIVLAFWSDATRVSTFMLDHGQSNRYFNFIDGVQGTWHALSHWRDASGNTEDDDGQTSWSSPAAKRAQYNAVIRWHNQQVAYFLGRLKAIREPNGQTLLDNSMILYGSNLADGDRHAEHDLPILLAGRGGGTIDSGRQIKSYSDRSMSDLHLALLKRMDPKVTRFAESKTPLDL